MTVLAEAGETQEIPHENATHVVWRLAWPAVALNSLQVVNTLLDRTFIGHLYTPALTAHGASMNVMFMMFSLAVALATGSTALVSRAYGANDPATFRKASRQALGLAIAAGLVIGAITLFGSPGFAKAILPATDHDAVREMSRFLTAYAFGLPAIYVIQTLAGSLRGIGDTKSPMVISGIQILLHIALNFLLIFPSHHVYGITIPGANWGLVGASAALSISAWIAAIAYVLFAGRTPLGVQWRVERPEWDWTRRILRIAVPAAVQSVLRVLSLTAFTLVLAMVAQGSEAIAAMSIAFAIESIMFMPAFGLSAAAGALVGQSLGMKQPERAERLAWLSAHHAALVTLALVGPIFWFAPQITDFLLDGKEGIVFQATNLLRYICATELLFAYAMVMIGAMQGAGDTTRPLWIAVFSLWGMRVPLAFILALKSGQPIGHGVVNPIGLGLGATGAWIAMSATQAVQGILSIFAFRQGKWKEKKV